jgi:hypothetical protein
MPSSPSVRLGLARRGLRVREPAARRHRPPAVAAPRPGAERSRHGAGRPHPCRHLLVALGSAASPGVALMALPLDRILTLLAAAAIAVACIAPTAAPAPSSPGTSSPAAPTGSLSPKTYPALLARAPVSAAGVEGHQDHVVLLYFPEDFPQGRHFYVFFWTDTHLAIDPRGPLTELERLVDSFTVHGPPVDATARGCAS